MYRIVIPARYASSRLPGKPLLAIAGRPMLEWVYGRARSTRAAEIVIATDDERIERVARAFGAEVMMTAANHATGTDRIAEVAARSGWRDDDIVVNLQGDEHNMPAELVEQVAALLHAHPSAAIATLATPVQSVEEYLDPNAVKVVTDLDGRALYFSRAPIPWDRDHGPSGQFDYAAARRHLGLYAYRVSALMRLATAASTALEELEKLEQLRALAHGMEIRVANAAQRPGPDVNTIDDLARAEAALASASR
jgi:3-deoxy-manno-octulosonate cytidylyltransferase (CMP-KDO synthetase)